MNPAKKNVFVAALDWGLGHTSRSVPLIRLLQKKGCHVIIGVSGMQKVFFESECPEAELIPLTGYNIQYSKSLPLSAGLLLSWPRLKKIMQQENEELKKICTDHKIEIIFSDNRYGLYHPDIFSVCITHQLNPQLPFLLNPFRENASATIQKLLQPFQEIWIPDSPEIALSGALSINPNFKNIFYSGIQSRFDTNIKTDKTFLYDIAVMLSGPEPHRSRFEKRILKQLTETSLKAVVFRGMPGIEEIQSTDNIHIFSHASTQHMQQMISDSHIVLCRAGYSSLCDLIRLNKKAIIIPTPGQTEQKYLAEYLSKKGWFHTVGEKKIHLDLDIDKALSLSPIPIESNIGGLLEQNIQRLLEKL
ncbi:MAG: glycosyltransferase [Bacteroidota bacterium]